MARNKNCALLAHCAAALCLLGLHEVCAEKGARKGDGSRVWEIEAVMPEQPAPPESYLCMTVDLPKEGALKVVGVEPLSSQELVHHMLLFGCEERSDAQGVWPCEGHGVCPGGGNQQILYGWAKGAPSVRLPHGVGYRVGSGTKIDNLVLQIHFAVERPQKDTSGVKLLLSNAHLPFSAGMLMYASYFEIPPKKEQHLVPTRCCYSGFEPTHGFAFRVHTHMLGRSVYLDEITQGEGHRRLVESSPQLPQGFTPVSGISFWPGQVLEATCNFNSTERALPTHAGATHHDEMCNLYMITWSELPVFMSCHGSHAAIDRHGPGGVPSPAALLTEDAGQWKPPQPLAHTSKPSSGGQVIGQVAGVAKGHNGTVWIFHRGDRVWDSASFSGSMAEHVSYREAISGDTVLQLDQDTGAVLSSWGSKTFFMPHMITVDRWGFLWLTDAGLHQVFKFNANGTLLATLGSRLEPGRGAAAFCKPTQVAVSNDGSVFVSDGYCNSRVAQFTANGTHLGDFVLPTGSMNVPHSVILEECSSALLVADRLASKVHRFDLSSRKHTGTWDLAKEGLVFGLAAGPYGTVFALCWDLNLQRDGTSRLALLHSDPGQGVEESWLLEGMYAPHDLAIVAAPVRLAGADRPLAVLVGETRPAGSRLQKYILVPAGETHLSNNSLDLGSATDQWKAVFAASAAKEEEIPPAIVTTKTADMQHAQAAIVTGHAHHNLQTASPSASQGKASSLKSTSLRLPSSAEASSFHFLLVSLPILFCCAGVVLAYRCLFRQHHRQHPHS